MINQTIEELINEFESDDRKDCEGYPYRSNIADELAEAGDNEVADYFLKKIRNENDEISWRDYGGAVWHLAKRDNSYYETIFTGLTGILENGKEQAKVKAVRIFEGLLFDEEKLKEKMKTKDMSYEERATEVLIGRLDDICDKVKIEAVNLMKYIKNTRVKNKLLELINNPSISMRRFAFCSLEKSYEDEPEIPELLSEGVYDNDICVRHVAMDIISKRRDIENCLKYVPRLIELFKEAIESERKSQYNTDSQDAAIALKNIKSKDSIDALLDYIIRGGVFLRSFVVRTLRAIGDKRALPILKLLLDHPSEYGDINNEITMKTTRETIDELESKFKLEEN